MSSLSWYIARLKRTSKREVLYRINQTLLKEIDKISYQIAQSSFSNINRTNITPRKDIVGIHELFPDIVPKIFYIANNAKLCNFSIFEINKDFGDPINWHLDPKTGNEWPLKFWGDIDYRDASEIGGIKFAWELNRLHHFPVLALAFRFSQDVSYKDELFEQLRSWKNGNPYPKGINWISGIELGIRVVNLVYALKLLGDETLTSQQEQLVTDFVYLHGRHLYRYPSKYSSCANHAVAEALGLFVSGLCFPGLKNADKWKKYGKKVLDREVERQIYPDGSSFEHSVPYLQFVLDHFLVYFLLCREYDEDYSEMVEKRLQQAFEFISSIMDENGNMPNIGDDDDGFLLKLELGQQNNFVSLLNTGAILFNKPEWIKPNAEFDSKTFFLLENESIDKWKILKNQCSNYSCMNRFFPDSGLAVIRDRSEIEKFIIGNSGPLGLVPLSGHGHADALSFTLTVDGKQILVDAGTYLYQSGGKWRRYFRSTAAHNTVRIDKQDQAPIGTDFIFGKSYNVNNAQLAKNNGNYEWSASHDGYTRLNDPVIHERKLVDIQGRNLIVLIDDISCEKEHLIECFFHFHPKCDVVLSGNLADVRCGNVKIIFKLDSFWDNYKLLKGSSYPILGWYSRSFNSVEKTYTLMCSKRIRGSHCFQTEISLIN